MPMRKGKSKEVIHENIKEMIAAGHDPKQAVAAAYHTAKMYDGGEVEDGSEEGEEAHDKNELIERSSPEDIPGPMEHDEDTKLILEALKKNRKY